MRCIQQMGAVLAAFSFIIPSSQGKPSLSSKRDKQALDQADLRPAGPARSTHRNPINYVSIIEDPLLISPAHRVHAHSNFDLTFLLHNRQQKIKLTLEPNTDILPDSIKVHRRNADGAVTDAGPVDRKAYKVFKGTAYVQRVGRSGYRQAGWARISVNRDGDGPIFVGAFQLDGDNHHIQTGKSYKELKHPEDPDVHVDDGYMVVWRDSDIVQPLFTGRKELKRDVLGQEACSADVLSYNAQYRALDTRDQGNMHSLSTSSLFGRQIDGSSGSGATVNLISNIGSTAGCPTTRKVALMGVATDCTYTASFDSEQDVRQNIINQVNLASEVYESTFNISLGIHALEISSRDCPSTPPPDAQWNVPCGSTTIGDRLNLFSAWRGTRQDSNAYWTLLSTCNTEAAVGLAWLGQLCINTASNVKSQDGSSETISGANVVVKTSTEWQVIAHEIGHTFGAVHDCMSSTCTAASTSNQSCCPLSRGTCDAGGQYIMNPSTSDKIVEFSQCSIGNICGAMNIGSTKTDCIVNNKAVSTISDSQCGNGIVEMGEDCDCGGETGCGENPCCDAKTCKFIGNAVCDPANEECCSDECQVASQGTVCRASTGACDPAETCPGNSATCPTNAHLSDGDSCGHDLLCASGKCTSRDLQCRTLVGASATDNSTFSCNDHNSCYMCCDSDKLDPSPQEIGQAYLDGTSCESSGKCYSGLCRGNSFGNDISKWFNKNKKIIIPVAAGVGGLILLAIAVCCFNAIRNRVPHENNMVSRKYSPREEQDGWDAYGGASYGGNYPGPAPPPRAAMSQHYQDTGLVDEWRPNRTIRYA